MKWRSFFYNIAIWWAILGVSVWLGGTVFMMSVIDPQWSANPPVSVPYFFKHTEFNKYIWYFFGPPFMLLRSAVPQILALALGWHSRFHRRQLLITILGTLLTIIFTLTYIYPINETLMAQAGNGRSPVELRRLTQLWLICDRVRFAINLIGFYFLLKAFRRPIDE